ncbi:hypothetical protein ANO11243_091780 [Dothideomycetidae sp. 11243]|nr:hypothetical protein ANO11243_091780 [fungal sp. No.11243]
MLPPGCLATVQRSNVLLDACRRGDLVTVKSLGTSLYSEPSHVHHNQSRMVPPIRVALCEAARSGHGDILRFFFDEIPACRDAPGGERWNPCTNHMHSQDIPSQWRFDNWHNMLPIVAATSGEPQVFQTLLDYGMSVQAAPERFTSPFEFALAHHDFVISEFLLSRGASIYGNGEPLGDSSLHNAARRGDTDALQFLLDHGAKIHGTNALEGAAKSGCVPTAELLLDAGADIDETFVPIYCFPDDESDGICSALHTAIKWDQLDFVRFLLRQAQTWMSRMAYVKLQCN